MQEPQRAELDGLNALSGDVVDTSDIPAPDGLGLPECVDVPIFSRHCTNLWDAMTIFRTPEQVKQAYIDAMGENSGSRFHALYEEVVELHSNWDQYVVLFGTKPSRVDLLNEAAPGFFKLIDEMMWEQTILHVTRVTDHPKSGNQQRLTIRALPSLVDTNIQHAVNAAIKDVEPKVVFCRDWRDRLLAHRDLKLAIGTGAKPLKLRSRQQMEGVLTAIANTLNVIANHYTKSTLSFSLPS